MMHMNCHTECNPMDGCRGALNKSNGDETKHVAEQTESLTAMI